MAPLSSTDLTEDKRALRREMGARRAALPESERRARSEAASARLLALPELGAAAAGARAPTVAGYAAAKNEIDPASALAGVTAAGATVALPRVAGGDGARLRVSPGRRAAGAGAIRAARAGRHGTRISLDALDVVIVPGLAFDGDGRRLGFGGGYYDGTFSGAGAGGKRPALIGLCYEFQVVPHCPAGPGDVPVDVVVTESRVLRRGAGGGPR